MILLRNLAARRAKLGAAARAIGAAARRFAADQRGNYAVLGAFLMPVIAGTVGLGVDVGFWYQAKQHMQGASDAAAVSAAAAYASNAASNITEQAITVASAYGFANGSQGVELTLNHPPSSGSYTTNLNAFEVIIQQPQNQYFSAVWGLQNVTVRTRSVALADPGLACVLALDPSANGALSASGTPTVALNNCSLFSNSSASSAISVGGASFVSALSAGAVGGISGAITTTEGQTTGDSPLSDPYANVSPPSFSGCTYSNLGNVGSTLTLSTTSGVAVICGGLSLTGGDVTLQSGTYIFDVSTCNTCLSISAQSTLAGSGVTLIFTSSTGSYPNNATAVKIAGGATIDLSPPTSGAYSGIVMYADRNMPVGTSFNLEGGASQVLTGATYLPKAAVKFAGGNNGNDGCAELVGDTVTFTGNSNFSVSCPNAPNVPIGSSSAKLVE
jgi:Flp pilus assembly protein TadG